MHRPSYPALSGPAISAPPSMLRRPPCENFLYVFKAARWAARAAASAPGPSLSLTLHSGRANAGRLARKRETRAADDLRVPKARLRVSLLPLRNCPGLDRTRQGRL